MSLDQEPPVHVRVARALGYRPVFEATSLHSRADQLIWRCLCPGPWIERFEIAVTPAELGPAEAAEFAVPCATRRVWVATHPGCEVCYSTTPLRAVCAWIIANVKGGALAGA